MMKNDFLTQFKNMPIGEKISTIGIIFITLAIVAVLVFQITGVFDIDADIFALLAGIENLLLGYSTRKNEGSVYKFNYGVGIFLIVLWILDAVLGGFDLL